MGVYTEVHVGFYLQVKPQSITRDREERMCSGDRSHHVGSRDSSFCGLCGGRIISQNVPEIMKAMRPYELLPDEFEDQFIPSGDGDIWLPNFRIATASGQDVNRQIAIQSDKYSMELEPESIARWKVALEKDINFKPVMHYMKEKYGEDSISLKYGVVIHHS